VPSDQQSNQRSTADREEAQSWQRVAGLLVDHLPSGSVIIRSNGQALEERNSHPLPIAHISHTGHELIMPQCVETVLRVPSRVRPNRVGGALRHLDQKSDVDHRITEPRHFSGPGSTADGILGLLQ
jgi:hypothetical protein